MKGKINCENNHKTGHLSLFDCDKCHMYLTLEKLIIKVRDFLFRSLSYSFH